MKIKFSFPHTDIQFDARFILKNSNLKCWLNFCPTFAADTKILYGYNFVAHLIIYCFISVVETENRFAVVIFLSENFKKYFLNISEKLHLNSYFSGLLVKLDYDREKKKSVLTTSLCNTGFQNHDIRSLFARAESLFQKHFRLQACSVFKKGLCHNR